jgi:hypothetical protein
LDILGQGVKMIEDTFSARKAALKKRFNDWWMEPVDHFHSRLFGKMPRRQYVILISVSLGWSILFYGGLIWFIFF